jgi:hypothetical protein
MLDALSLCYAGCVKVVLCWMRCYVVLGAFLCCIVCVIVVLFALGYHCVAVGALSRCAGYIIVM